MGIKVNIEISGTAVRNIVLAVVSIAAIAGMKSLLSDSNASLESSTSDKVSQIDELSNY